MHYAPSANSLWEQTIAREPDRMQVVVVDDGSTDAIADVAYRLQRLGKINEFFRLQQRGARAPALTSDRRRSR